MSFGLFEKEAKVIKRAKANTFSTLFSEKQVALYKDLLDEYEKLLKSSKRVMKVSDRNEEKLNRMARDLDAKNKTLEQLSAKLGKYLSPQIYDSIFSGSREVELSTERKKLTVCFTDIENFTLTTEDMQPEDLTQLLNSYFTEMSEIALRHGATIDKFVGDAIVLFFGDPETKGVKGDAEACVRMSIEMQQRMQSLRTTWRALGYEKPFKIRIGIHTGYCNVGNFGSDTRMDYTIIGGEVNLAARLESQAKAGGILMSHETYSLVRDFIVAEEWAPIEVKGIRREIRPCAFVGLRGQPGTEHALVSHDQNGLFIQLNAAEIAGEDKAAAVSALKKALSVLES